MCPQVSQHSFPHPPLQGQNGGGSGFSGLKERCGLQDLVSLTTKRPLDYGPFPGSKFSKIQYHLQHHPNQVFTKSVHWAVGELTGKISIRDG